MSKQGLRETILSAKSAESITELLKVGSTFEFASRKTRNSWKSAGRRRLAALKGEKPVAEVSEESEEVVATSKKKRGNKKKEDRKIA